MHLKAMQDEVRSLLSEGERIIGAARRERREATSAESKRLGVIDQLTKELQEGIEGAISADQHARSIEARREAMSRPIERPIEDGNDYMVENRSDPYNHWPIEESNAFFHAVRTFTKTKTLPASLSVEQRDALSGALEGRAITGMSTLIDSDGGFLVPSTISQTILRKMHEEGQILSRVQQIQLSTGNTIKFPVINESSRATSGTPGSRYGGVTAYRIPEGGEKTGSKPSLGQIGLSLKKLAALVYITDELVEDSMPAVMVLVNELAPKAITFAIEREIVEGLGGAEMEGILASPSLITVAKETGQAAGTVTFENISKMRNRLVASSRSNYVWLIHQDVESQLEKMYIAIGTGGIPVYMPANGVSGQPYSTLYGRPVILCEHCSAAGTIGDIIAADLSQYLYITKGGIRSAQSIHVRFVQDETVMRFVLRNDGKSWWSAPLTPAKGSNTVSPFVALATRA